MRDSIPLEEIVAVEAMSEGKKIHLSSRSLNSHSSRRTSREASLLSLTCQQDSPTLISSNAFKIQTVENGYNSGRIYYVQVDSSDELDDSITTIRAFVNSARTKAEVASRYNRAKLVALAIYESPIFQILSAFLIILVRYPYVEKFPPL